MEAAPSAFPGRFRPLVSFESPQSQAIGRDSPERHHGPGGTIESSPAIYRRDSGGFVVRPMSLFSGQRAPQLQDRLADGACCGATASWSAGSPLPLSHGMRRPESLPQCSRYKRLHSSIVRPACESGRGLFPLPTSLRPAWPSRNRCSKACHPERSPRSEGPRNTPQNVQLFQGSLEAGDLLSSGN